MFRSTATAIGVACACALASCGGGGGGNGSNNDAMVDVRVATAAAAQAGDTIRVSATIHARKHLLANAYWTAQTSAGTAPALTLGNADCAAAQKSDTKFSNYDESVWICEAQALAPPDMAADATYRFVVRGVDAAGNSGSGYTDVAVKATPIQRPPLVVSTDPSHVALLSATKAALSCTARGGYLGTGASYTYAWRVVSNPSALQIAMTDDGKGGLQFTAPDVAYATSVTFACAATDTALATATANTVIDLNPLPVARPVVIADAGAAQLVKAQSVVSLDASKSSVSVGGQTQTSPIFFQWVQTAGPAVALSGATSARPSFLAPPVTGITQLKFKVMADTSPIGDGSAVQPSGTAETAVYVSMQSPLDISVAPVPPVQPGASTTVTASVQGAGSGEAVWYAWTQVSGPRVTLSGASSKSVTFIAPDVTAPSLVTLRVRAARSPDELASAPPAAQTEVSISITPVAPPPALSVQIIGPATPVGPNEVANLQTVVTGSLPGETLYYAWAQVGGPPVTLGTLTSASTSFVAPTVASTSLVTLRVMVARSPGDLGRVPPSAMTEASVAIRP